MAGQAPRSLHRPCVSAGSQPGCVWTVVLCVSLGIFIHLVEKLDFSGGFFLGGGCPNILHWH